MSIKKHSKLLFILLIAITNIASAQITEIGLASFYADKFDGRITASGEIFDQNKMTAAHRTLPFGTRVKVTNMVNKKSIEVVINDRGPFVNDRVIDLSKTGAIKLDFMKKGVVKVKVEVIDLAKSKQTATRTSTKKQEPKTQTKPKPTKKQTKTSATVATSSTSSSSVSSEALSYYQVDTDLITPKGYGIQVASYQEAANLMQRCNDLKREINKDIIVQVADTHGKKVYRIIIGTFPTKDQAENYKKSITRKYTGCFVLGF